MVIKDIAFTEREVDVIACICNGKSVKDSAQVLEISPYTVSSHVSNIIRKINVSSQGEVVKFLESSDQYLLIRNKYIDLLLNSNFKSILKKISNLGVACNRNVIVHTNGSLLSCYKEMLKVLKSVGIPVSVDNNFSNDYLDEFSSNSFHIVMLSSNINDEYKFPSTQKNIIAVSSRLNKYYTCKAASGIAINKYMIVIYIIDAVYNDSEITKLLYSFPTNYIDQSSNNFAKKEIITANKNDYKKNRQIIYIFSMLSMLFVFCFSFIKYERFLKPPQIGITNLQIMDNSRMLHREKLIRIINEACRVQNGVKYVFLIGAGGIGKTTAARQYMATLRSLLKWEIDAETEHKMMHSLYEVAEELANTEDLKKELALITINAKSKKSKLFKFVVLQLKRFDDWGLLFDNVEDFANLKHFTRLLQNSLLQKGHVLVTTRDQNSEYLMEFPRTSFINVPALTDNEKTSLFYSMLPNTYNLLNQTLQDRIKDILRDVPSYPLDISVFAHYITINNLNINDLEYYRKETNRLITYNEARYSILQKSFHNIINNNSANIYLLTLLFLLDSTDISVEYFLKISPSSTVTKFFSLLKKHGIVSINKGVFCIHRSIQETGLMILDKLEKGNAISLKEVISKIAVYESFVGGWYRNRAYSYTYSSKMVRHLESILHKLKFYQCDKKILDECKLRILLSLFYAKKSSVPQERLCLGNEILKLTNRISVLTKYDIALLYLNMAKLYADTGDFGKCLQSANQCIFLAKKFNFRELLAPGLVFISRYDKKLTEIKKHQMINDAIKIIESLPNYYYGSMIDTANQIYRFYGTNYINQPSTTLAVNFLQKMSLKLKDFVYASDFSSCLQDFLEMKMNMIRGYNRLGEFDNALPLIKELEKIYKKLKKLGINMGVAEARLDVEKGFVFLRQNDLIEALNLFSKIIDSKFLKEITDLFYVYVYRSEALIRLGRFREAYEDCVSALNHRESSFNSKYAQLTKLVCYYNVIMCAYKMKKDLMVDKYVKLFFKEAKEFCATFLPKHEFNQLVQKNNFNSGGQDKFLILKKCKNIFEKIYGNDLSFIKDYINTNLNNGA